MSSISALLKEAAKECVEEERELAAETMQAAAKSVVAEGMGLSELSDMGPIAAMVSEKSVKADVEELLAQMDIKPKYSGDAMDDVDALLMLKKTKMNTKENTKENTNRTASSMDLYRRRRSQRDNMSAGKSMATANTWSSFNTEPSRVSVLLSVADEKPWGSDMRYAFKSAQQEALFRSMKVVRPASAGAQRTAAAAKNLSLSTRDRLERHNTCSLDVHAMQKRGVALERSQKMRQDMRSSADRMCGSGSVSRQPSSSDIKADPSLRYSRFDDAKECTFRPRIHGKENKKSNDDDEHRDDAGFAFINRQEAEERNRRDELEFQIGKAKYDALVNKKACPQCGQRQSYDEYKEKRRNCGNCNIEYCAQVSWNKVGKRFLKKNLEYAQRVAEKKTRLRSELEEEFKCIQRREYDPLTGKSHTYTDYNKQRLTAQEELEFFDRIDSMLQHRESKVKELDDKIYRDNYPFKPTITKYARRDDKDDDDDSDLEPSEAFLKRYNQDLESRRDKFPTKYLRSKYQREEEDEWEPFRG
ncbi:hypothetical protein B484DRAFT_453446 [Ochromonadaceae sp. CCMP2298]|nr:hypothetical protein B484DRAFT_453446 [Ochromonadaceae sp. CCMP2298]|mmetsp:Transcript_18834/g.42085  ORF Transcript_18834/g.42085 Transcript_18834/m.42085 type:complete len:530 (-) Transcript_18834:70-1659(-)